MPRTVTHAVEGSDPASRSNAVPEPSSQPLFDLLADLIRTEPGGIDHQVMDVVLVTGFVEPRRQFPHGVRDDQGTRSALFAFRATSSMVSGKMHVAGLPRRCINTSYGGFSATSNTGRPFEAPDAVLQKRRVEKQQGGPRPGSGRLVKPQRSFRETPGWRPSQSHRSRIAKCDSQDHPDPRESGTSLPAFSRQTSRTCPETCCPEDCRCQTSGRGRRARLAKVGHGGCLARS